MPKMLHDEFFVMDELHCLLMLHECYVHLRGGVAHVVALSIPLPAFLLISWPLLDNGKGLWACVIP